MRSLVHIPGVRIAAVCDIYDVHLDQARKLADSQAVASKHYREILDRKDIHAVANRVADHWHVPMTIDAMAGGKDVYVEKPLTHKMRRRSRAITGQHSPSIARSSRSARSSGACRTSSGLES